MFVVTFTLLLLSLAIHVDSSLIDDKITTLLEESRDVLTNGQWVLPSLDPMRWENDTFHFQDDTTDSEMSTTLWLTLTGFSQYKVVSVETNGLHFEIKLVIDQFHAVGKADNKGQFGAKLPVNGHINVTALASDLYLTFIGDIVTNPSGFMSLDPFDMRVHVGKLNVVLDGLQGGKFYDKLIGRLVDAYGPLFVNSHEVFVGKEFAKAMIKFLNPAFNQFTVDELMDLINS